MAGWMPHLEAMGADPKVSRRSLRLEWRSWRRGFVLQQSGVWSHV